MTKIQYTLPSDGSSQVNSVLLKVFDILGNEIAVLVDEEQTPGTYEVGFNSTLTGNSFILPSGVYFYQLQVGEHFQTKKMMLLQ